MSLSDEYRELATLIDALESKGVAVREAAPVGGDGQGGTASDRFSVRLVVDLPDGTVTGESDDELVGEQSRQRTRDAAERANGRDETDDSETDDAPAADAVSDEVNAVDGEPDDSETDEVNAVDDEPDDSETDDASAVDGEPNDSETDDTDGVDCTHPDCARTFESERGMKIHRTKAHPLSEIIDPDATGAVHQDPEALADVYDQYETFAEMTEALDADVGAQAVRKQMIRHGIHEPEGQAPGEGASGAVGVQTLTTDADRDGDDPDRLTGSANGDTRNGTASKNGVDDSDDPDDHDPVDDSDDSNDRDPVDDSDDSNDHDPVDDPDDRDPVDDSDDHDPVDDSDDHDPVDDSNDHDAADDPGAEESVAARLPELDLPGDLTTAELKTAVETANTLYDVQRALDLDSETTRDVLSEYDLLELVSGRAASVRDREELKSEIYERLRRTAA